MWTKENYDFFLIVLHTSGLAGLVLVNPQLPLFLKNNFYTLYCHISTVNVFTSKYLVAKPRFPLL